MDVSKLTTDRLKSFRGSLLKRIKSMEVWGNPDRPWPKLEILKDLLSRVKTELIKRRKLEVEKKKQSNWANVAVINKHNK